MSEILIPVPAEWKRRAFIDAAKYEEMYQASIRDPEMFWAQEARKLEWITPFKQVKDVSYDAKNLHIRWFYDGTLNVSVNCLDRHLKTRGGQTAIIWEGDDPKVSRHISYAELHREVSPFANVLKANGAQKGDRVTIYLPMIPEVGVRDARLRAHRRGPFGGVRGFSPDSLAGRIQDCEQRARGHGG